VRESADQNTAAAGPGANPQAAAPVPRAVPPVDLRALIDLIEAADFLSISARLLADLVAKGEVPHVRVNRRLLFRTEALRAWAAARERGGAR
jgi:excisionase family DNA binding protein